MTPRMPRAPLARAGLVIVALSAALFVTALVRAIRITPVPPAQGIAAAEVARVSAVAPVPEIDLDAVGGNGIFQPDRNPLPYRYRMPGESGPEAPAPEPERPVVLGTVIATDGSHFATCQLPGGRPTTVRVGDKLGDYTVVAIERNKVAFRTAGGRLIEITTRPGT